MHAHNTQKVRVLQYLEINCFYKLYCAARLSSRILNAETICCYGDRWSFIFSSYIKNSKALLEVVPFARGCPK